MKIKIYSSFKLSISFEYSTIKIVEPALEQHHRFTCAPLLESENILSRCACLVRTGIEILTSAGQLIDWKATIHFDTTPWEAVNLRATRASANRVDAGVSLLNKKQRDIFTEPEPCSPCQKLERRKEGEICCKTGG